MYPSGLAGSDGVVETIEEGLHLLDGLLAGLAGGVPVPFWGDAVETEEALEEQLAEAEIVFFVRGLVIAREEIVELWGEGGADGGELGVDGGEDGAFLGGYAEGRRLVGDDGGGGGGWGGEEDEDGAWPDARLMESGPVVVQDSALVDELEGVYAGVFSEGRTDGGEGRVWGGQGEGEAFAAPFDGDGHGARASDDVCEFWKNDGRPSAPNHDMDDQRRQPPPLRARPTPIPPSLQAKLAQFQATRQQASLSNHIDQAANALQNTSFSRPSPAFKPASPALRTPPRPAPGMAGRRQKPAFSLRDIDPSLVPEPPAVSSAAAAGLGAGRPSALPPSKKSPPSFGSPFSNFSKIVDPSGALNFSGKAILHSTGVNFSNGASFAINMGQLQLDEELGKGNYGTVKKVLHKPTNVAMAMKVSSVSSAHSACL